MAEFKGRDHSFGSDSGARGPQSEYQGKIKETDSGEGSSSEFNLDEEIDSMPEQKEALSPKKDQKKGGFRDYSVDHADFDSVKLAYKTHDGRSSRSRILEKAKRDVLSMSRDASIANSLRKRPGVLPLESQEELPLQILEGSSAKFALRTPNLEDALVADCMAMKNQMTYENLCRVVMIEKELSECGDFKKDSSDTFFNKEQLSDDNSDVAQSPIAVKNMVRLSFGEQLVETFGKKTKEKKPGKNKISGLENIDPKYVMRNISDLPPLDDFETETAELIHNSDLFSEQVPLNLAVKDDKRDANTVKQTDIKSAHKSKHVSKNISLSIAKPAPTKANESFTNVEFDLKDTFFDPQSPRRDGKKVFSNANRGHNSPLKLLSLSKINLL